VRAVAILAAYNEERFIGGCLDHLLEQGLEAYLIDNHSTDKTVEIAEQYLGRGLIGIETLPRNEGTYRWGAILQRKEELAASLEADWFMHADPDEFRLPPRSDSTLAQALAEVDGQGYNAVNFLEFTFVPTREAPDHDHHDFLRTMKWYYPFQRHFPVRVTAWKRQPERVALARSAGHRVKFPNLRLYPESFKMRHYLCLSVPHALRKYAGRKYDVTEVQKGWHGWRARVVEEKIKLPSQAELHFYTSDDRLDLSNPRTQHITEDWSLARKDGTEPDGKTVSAQRSTPRLQQARPGGTDPTGSSSTVSRRISTAQNATQRPGSSRGRGPVCIGGMHRSGTSMVAKLLHGCGLYLGLEQDLMPPASYNPGGFWENLKFVEINETILNEFGGAWDCPPPMPDGWELQEEVLDQGARAEALLQEFTGHEPWGWKDPRNSLTLPFWMALVPDIKSVVCVRNPLEVALSLHRRNGVSYAFGIRLWQTYYERILEASSVKDRILTRYDAYFQDPRAELRRVLDFLEIPVTDRGIDSCLSEAPIGLRHNRFTVQNLRESNVPPAVVESYVRMCEEAGWIGDDEVHRGSKANDPSPDTGRRWPEGNGGGGHRLSNKQPRVRASGKGENTMPPEANATSAGVTGQLDMSAVEAELLRQEQELLDTEFAGSNSQLDRLKVDQYAENLKERYEALILQHKERYRALVADHRKLKARGDSLEHQLQSAEDQLQTIENSRVWRLFGPYRRLRARAAASKDPG